MESKALMTMDQTTMMSRINAAKFPQALTEPDKRLLALVAITYGFDPLMGEITIYQGKPYVSIDGRYRKAQETGLFMGMSTRPATKSEKTEWEIPEGDFFFHAEAEVYNKEAKRTAKFVGWGRIRTDEMKINNPGDKYKPIVTNPQRMAEKRAEAQALRKAFHINLPSIEMAGTGTEEDENNPNIINVETGEIIPEGEKPKADPVQAEKDINDLYGQKEPVKKQPVASKEAVEPKKTTTETRDPATVKTISHLWEACYKDFKLNPPDVLKILGVQSGSDIADSIPDCYIKVRDNQKAI
jgi:hypothetical protein